MKLENVRCDIDAYFEGKSDFNIINDFKKYNKMKNVMKTNYFLVTEQDDSIVAVIGAVNNEEFNSKLEIALMEHFDSNIGETPTLDLENCLYGRIDEFSVKVDFSNDDDYIATIFIQEVILY